MKIFGSKFNFYNNIIKPTVKKMFNFKGINLERTPARDVVEVNVFHNTAGIKSDTFNKLLSPEFTRKRTCTNEGMRVTTLIDKKTQKPVEAFVGMVQSDTPDCERYLILVKDEKGDFKFQGKNYSTVGSTLFYINKKRKMITPKFELIMKDGELYEQIHSHMKAKGNDKYAGIGTRLHQLRVERMLHNDLGNVEIVADGNSFPFHYAMGYRLRPQIRPIEDAVKIMQEFSHFNKKPFKENAKYLTIEMKDNKEIINFSASVENFLNDHYKNGGAPIENLTPNMYLDITSYNQWKEMITKQPILSD